MRTGVNRAGELCRPEPGSQAVRWGGRFCCSLRLCVAGRNVSKLFWVGVATRGTGSS